jgi:hypothetical protein
VVCAVLQGIPNLGELKLRYYQLMITYHQHYHSYLEICRCYKAIYEGDGVQDDPAVWGPVSVALDFLQAVAGNVAGDWLLQWAYRQSSIITAPAATGSVVSTLFLRLMLLDGMAGIIVQQPYDTTLVLVLVG